MEEALHLAAHLADPARQRDDERHSQDALAAKLEAIGMPFAPIAKPWDLLDDPHLKASGGLLETAFQGKTAHVPALPIELDGERLANRSDPPGIGQHGKELLAGLGCSPHEIDTLLRQRIVAFPTQPRGEET